MTFTCTYVSAVNDGFVSLLPTCEFFASNRETQLGDVVTQSANAAVLREVQHRLQANQLRKRKAYTVFIAEQSCQREICLREWKCSGSQSVIKDVA